MDRQQEHEFGPEFSGELKEVVKEAIQEWLDKQYATFGKWSLAGLFSMALAGLLWFWISTHGFDTATASQYVGPLAKP